MKKFLAFICLALCALMVVSCGTASNDTASDTSADTTELKGAEIKIATLNGPTTIGVLGLLKGDASQGSKNTLQRCRYPCQEY